MTSAAPNDRYLGCQKFSSFPEGLLPRIAPSPGPLCSKCSTLDYPGYFVTKASSTANLVNDDKHFLGTYRDISRKAINCDFCLLAIEALKNGTIVPGLDTSFLSVDSRPLNVYIDSAWSGSYYLRREESPDDPGEKQSEHVDVRCIVVYTDAPIPGEVRRTDQDRAFIRLLANDAHILGQQPMYHGRIIGNHVSPGLLQTWIKTCNDHHQTCNKIRVAWGMEH